MPIIYAKTALGAYAVPKAKITHPKEPIIAEVLRPNLSEIIPVNKLAI